MKKILLIASLFASATLFASGHGGDDLKCTIAYNHCMGDCSVKYGSDTECVATCKYNYENCKAGIHMKDYTAPTAAKSSEEAPKKEENGHH
jgi:hypothetical protein